MWILVLLDGILKRDWLLKHRTIVLVVAAALISSDNVSGDPAAWLVDCFGLENLKTKQELECMFLIARLGPHLTICYQAENPASMDDLPLLCPELSGYSSCLAFSGQKVVQVEEPDPHVGLLFSATSLERGNGMALTASSYRKQGNEGGCSM